MGRNLSDHSESPVKARVSSHRRSPSRRERSPTRRRSSNNASSPVREKPSNRTRSPRRAKSRSPVPRSPVREKPLSRTRSPRRAMSRSPVSHSLIREKPLSHTRSPRRTKSKSPEFHNLAREKAAGHTRSPIHEKLRSPLRNFPSRERTSNHTRSPKQPKSVSPVSHSPSPRTKRLRRAQAEIKAGKASEGEQKRDHKGSDRSTHRERDSERELGARREKRSGRDAADNGSSRSNHGKSTSPSYHHRMKRHRSRSPNAADPGARDEVNNSKGGEHGNANDDSVAKMAAAAEALENKAKQKPSFELSGKLAAETNRVRGVTLLFTEPPDSRIPDIRWRLYVFKGGDMLNEPLYVHRQPSYLFGRERRVAEIPTDHPSCSKQHAVLQYRQVEKEQPDGTLSKQVRPYIMDLGSTNGTFINQERIEPQRYYELFEGDTVKFGNSSREYVLLHEQSAG